MRFSNTLLHGEVSATLLQRKLKIGFARAARIMDELAEMDIVASSPDSKTRKVINWGRGTRGGSGGEKNNPL